MKDPVDGGYTIGRGHPHKRMMSDIFPYCMGGAAHWKPIAILIK
jgi:hypothetical protein